MKLLTLTTALVALGLAGAANALSPTITITLSSGNDATFNNNPLGAYSGASSAFYDGAPGPIRFIAGADTVGVFVNSIPGAVVPPSGETTHYVYGLNDGTSVFFPKDIHSFKIHWGSIDAVTNINLTPRWDNVLTLSNGNVITGSDLVALGLADGLGDYLSAGDNKWFLITDTTAFNSFTATSSESSFEFDMAVPEPSTWAMMLIGFGAMGVATRRQRRMRTVNA